MKKTNTYFIIFTSLFLTSCGLDLDEYYGREGLMTPRPALMGDMPNGDDPYSQGVRDGCNTAIGLMHSGPMRSMYDQNYIDFERTLEDSQYNRGRNVGFNYCMHFVDVDPL